MDRLPSPLVDEILFRMDLKTLAKMQCTDKYFRSRLSEDPYFKSEYNSRVGSNLFYMASYGSKLVCYLPFFGSTLPRAQETLKLEFQVLGSCSGLLLLFCQGLCVANPFTKKFRFVDHSRSNLFPRVNTREVVHWGKTMYIGFAVYQIDRTAQKFKIVCVKDSEARNPDETMYQFEINEGDSWRLTKTTVTCRSSNFDKRMRPVYANGSLHWLRNDGSILAFNLETEKVRLIPIKFPQELSVKTLFAAADNKLTLIWPTKEEINIYALENILTDPKWVLVRRIGNVVADAKRLIYWDVVAYSGRFLMLREKNEDCSDGVVHRYDLRANKWGVMGWIPKWCGGLTDIYLFTPSYTSVIGLDETLKPCDDDKRISSLSSMMGLVVGISSEKTETQLTKISIEEEETEPMLKKQRN